jgi:cation transport ATPase
MFDKTGTLFTKIDKIENYSRVRQGVVSIIEIDTLDSSNKLKEEEDRKETIVDLTDSDLWGMIGKLEKDITHPLATLLYKEAVKRSDNRIQNYVMNMKPEITRSGIIGTLFRSSDHQEFLCHIGSK